MYIYIYMLYICYLYIYIYFNYLMDNWAWIITELKIP